MAQKRGLITFFQICFLHKNYKIKSEITLDLYQCDQWWRFSDCFHDFVLSKLPKIWQHVWQFLTEDMKFLT